MPQPLLVRWSTEVTARSYVSVPRHPIGRLSGTLRLALLSGSAELSPRSRNLLASLTAAGHDVAVAHRRTSRFRGERFECALTPAVIWPATSTAVDAADHYAISVDGWVSRRPDWAVPTRDHMAVVPERPELATPAGWDPAEPAPWDAHTGVPVPGRHARRKVVLAFRSTPSSPGHYLRNALERAGATVIVTDAVDLSEHSEVDAVVVVESPTPPLTVVGHGAVPVLFWVHHGEHHLDGNLRLARRYGAGLVLMAHSWHLALRFATRVERFPFAVAPELSADRATGDRSVDLALVGATEGSAYSTRRALVEQARAALDRVEVTSGITPRQMAELYRRSKAVLNEGGTRHRPITMRVFEAIGSGALLVSESTPGMDLLFPGLYEAFGDGGLDGDRLAEVLAGPGAAVRAAAAHQLAMKAHTYDHRVDLLFRFVDGLERSALPRPPDPTDPVLAFLDHHPYVQRILDATGTIDAPDHEVTAVAGLKSEPKAAGFDMVMLDRSSPPSLALAARRFVVGRGLRIDELPITPAEVHRLGGLTIVDTGAPAYDERTVGGPAAM